MSGGFKYSLDGPVKAHSVGAALALSPLCSNKVIL